jgi:hypothetical protein
MRLTHLLPLGLAASVSAQSLATILANNNATLSTLSSTDFGLKAGRVSG